MTTGAGAESARSEAERATRRLRDEIVSGVRAPGSRLVERDLAADYGVSRVPIRDALRALGREGLVLIEPHRAAVVREFSASDVVDLYEVRSALDVLSFRLAALRHDRAGLRRLREVLDDGVAAAARDDEVRARLAAAEFHDVVTALSGNVLLSEVTEVIRSRLRWLFAQHDDLVEMANEHERLYQAIAARDADLVEKLVLDHLVVSREHKARHDGVPT